MQQWEHKVIHAPTNTRKELQATLVELGAEGWEAVSIAGSDKTLGLNALMVIVRREIVPPDPLTGQEAEWYPDPCGRFEKRYWNGHMWTAHVANVTAKERTVDPPQTLAG